MDEAKLQLNVPQACDLLLKAVGRAKRSHPDIPAWRTFWRSALVENQAYCEVAIQPRSRFDKLLAQLDVVSREEALGRGNRRLLPTIRSLGSSQRHFLLQRGLRLRSHDRPYLAYYLFSDFRQRNLPQPSASFVGRPCCGCLFQCRASILLFCSLRLWNTYHPDSFA